MKYETEPNGAHLDRKFMHGAQKSSTTNWHRHACARLAAMLRIARNRKY